LNVAALMTSNWYLGKLPKADGTAKTLKTMQDKMGSGWPYRTFRRVKFFWPGHWPWRQGCWKQEKEQDWTFFKVKL